MKSIYLTICCLSVKPSAYSLNNRYTHQKNQCTKTASSTKRERRNEKQNKAKSRQKTQNSFQFDSLIVCDNSNK